MTTDIDTYHIGPFELGQIKAHMSHGLGCTQISRRVQKPDGKSFYDESAIGKAMKKLRENKRWRGERKEGSMRPRKTTKKQDTQIVKYVEKYRGEEKVTVTVLKKRFPYHKLFHCYLIFDY